MLCLIKYVSEKSIFKIGHLYEKRECWIIRERCLYYVSIKIELCNLMSVIFYYLSKHLTGIWTNFNLHLFTRREVVHRNVFITLWHAIFISCFINIHIFKAYAVPAIMQ